MWFCWRSPGLVRQGPLDVTEGRGGSQGEEGPGGGEGKRHWVSGESVGTRLLTAETREVGDGGAHEGSGDLAPEGSWGGACGSLMGAALSGMVTCGGFGRGEPSVELWLAPWV